MRLSALGGSPGANPVDLRSGACSGNLGDAGGLARGNFENVCLCRGGDRPPRRCRGGWCHPFGERSQAFLFVRPKRVAAPQFALVDVPRFSAVLSLTTSVGRFLLRRDGLRRQYL